jgi:hypothetical protein
MPSMADAYPITRYTAPLRPPPNFTSKAKRARMDRTSPQTSFYIIERWQIRDQDARELPGGASNGRYYQMKKNRERRILSADNLSNISYWIGIFKVLNIWTRDALMTGGSASQTQTGSRRSNPCTRACGLRWKSLENSSRPGFREHDRFAEIFY